MVLQFIQALPRLMSSVTLDDNSVGLIACIIGAVGSFYLTNYREKLKAQKAKVERKDELPPGE